MKEHQSFLWRNLICLDNWANVLLSAIPSLKRKGFGFPDETISSVVGKRYYYFNDRSWFIMLIYKSVEKLDPGHFRRYIEYDEGVQVGEIKVK